MVVLGIHSVILMDTLSVEVILGPRASPHDSVLLRDFEELEFFLVFDVIDLIKILLSLFMVEFGDIGKWI